MRQWLDASVAVLTRVKVSQTNTSKQWNNLDAEAAFTSETHLPHHPSCLSDRKIITHLNIKPELTHEAVIWPIQTTLTYHCFVSLCYTEWLKILQTILGMHRVSVGRIYSAKLGFLDNRTLGYPQVAMKESNCANPTFLVSPRAERGIKAGHPIHWMPTLRREPCM